MAVSSDKSIREFWIGEPPGEFGDLDMDEDEIGVDADMDFDDAIFDDRGETLRTYTARQRIEIAREDKWLESAMSDFDDYYEIEDFEDYYAAKFSH